MKRIHVRQSIMGNKRALGRRIKRGLDELGPLDAPSDSPNRENEPLAKKKKHAGEPENSILLGRTEEGKIKKVGCGDDGSSVKRMKSVMPSDENSSTSSTHSEEGVGDPSPNAGRVDVFDISFKDWKEAKQLLLAANQSIMNQQESQLSSMLAKKHFLTYCELWHARSRLSCPLPAYIEASELLIQAMLLDQSMDQEEAPLASATPPHIPPPLPSHYPRVGTIPVDSPFFFSTRMVRLFYGAVLSRIVHVLTGSFSKSKSLNTYRKRAKELKLPEELVEVRQRVAHGSVPTITELRWVASMAWQYLFQQFWIPEEKRYQEKLREEEETELKRMKQKQHLLHRSAKHVESVLADSPLMEGGAKQRTFDEEQSIGKEKRPLDTSSEGDYSLPEMKMFLASLGAPHMTRMEGKDDDGQEEIASRNLEAKREEEKMAEDECSNTTSSTGSGTVMAIGEANEKKNIEENKVFMGWEVC